jgi:MFS family permease
MGALAKPLIGFSSSWLHVLGARALDRTGKGIRTAPRDALISDSVSAQSRGAAFGWHRAMDTLGAAIGPLLTLYLLNFSSQDHSEDLRNLYYWALIPGLISVLFVMSVKERAPTNSIAQKWENPFLSWIQMSRSYKKYILSWGIFSLTNSSDIFLLMRVKQSGANTVTVILIYCFYNLVYALTSPLFGKLSDKMNRRKVLTFGLAIFCLVYLGFSFAVQNWQYWLLFGIYGLYMGATDGVGKALAIDLSPEGLKATGVGILGTVTGICTLIASLSAGLIWDQLGAPATFVFGAVGALIATFLLSTHSKDPN